jgi:hypothetical protein
MSIENVNWMHTYSNNFELAVGKNIPVNSEMDFTGYVTDNYLNQIWAPGNVRLWVPNGGKWERKVSYPNADDSLIETFENDIDSFFPSEAFTPLDEILNDKSSMVFDYENNEVRWNWEGKQVYPMIDNCLNKYVFKYPFSQKVTEEGSLACLQLNSTFEGSDRWNCKVVSTEVDDMTINREGSICWFVSCFENMETNTGTVINRGTFYKMSSWEINLKKTPLPNSLIKIIFT